MRLCKNYHSGSGAIAHTCDAGCPVCIRDLTIRAQDKTIREVKVERDRLLAAAKEEPAPAPVFEERYELGEGWPRQPTGESVGLYAEPKSSTKTVVLNWPAELGPLGTPKYRLVLLRVRDDEAR